MRVRFCRRATYAMRGSNPRPMAHKTIALATELMAPCAIGQFAETLRSARAGAQQAFGLDAPVGAPPVRCGSKPRPAGRIGARGSRLDLASMARPAPRAGRIFPCTPPSSGKCSVHLGRARDFWFVSAKCSSLPRWPLSSGRRARGASREGARARGSPRGSRPTRRSASVSCGRRARAQLLAVYLKPTTSTTRAGQCGNSSIESSLRLARAV